jgi:hypothetical protein
VPSPWQQLLNFAGAMVFHQGGSHHWQSIVDGSNVTQLVVLAGVTGAII